MPFHITKRHCGHGTACSSGAGGGHHGIVVGALYCRLCTGAIVIIPTSGGLTNGIHTRFHNGIAAPRVAVCSGGSKGWY